MSGLQKTSMPINNEGHKAIVWRDRIWVVGGYAGSSVSINSVYSYDPKLDSWRTEASLNKTRVWHSIWAINDQLYVGGGGFGNAYQTMEMYDSLGSKWDELPVSLPQNSYVSGAAVLGNSLYLLGGSTSTSPTDVSNKVYAADLNASVAGVYDLYRKDGNASAGTPLVQAEVADGSVTTAKLAPEVQAKLDQNTTIGAGTITKSMLAQEVLNDLNASTTSNNQPVVGSLIAQAYGQPAPSGYSLYQQGTPKELFWEEKAPASVARGASDGIEVLDEKIYFVLEAKGRMARQRTSWNPSIH